jgi:hypothetical protein
VGWPVDEPSEEGSTGAAPWMRPEDPPRRSQGRHPAERDRDQDSEESGSGRRSW